VVDGVMSPCRKWNFEGVGIYLPIAAYLLLVTTEWVADECICRHEGDKLCSINQDRCKYALLMGNAPFTTLYINLFVLQLHSVSYLAPM